MRIIAGEYRGRVLRTAEGPGYRPATGKVREALFSMLESRGVRWPGTRVADFFAGSGSLALEALSRGAAFALMVEKNRRAAALIRENLRELDVERSLWRVEARDLFTLLNARPDTPYDIVFIDPPYGKGLLAPALSATLDKGWLAGDGLVIAEVEETLDVDAIGVHDRLEKCIDRTYGQTRICAWRIRTAE